MYKEYPELTLPHFNITSMHFTMDSIRMNFKGRQCVSYVNNAAAISRNSLNIKVVLYL